MAAYGPQSHAGEHPSAIRRTRTVAEYALAGAVTSGVLFGWAPLPFDVHAIGAVIGAALGMFAVVKKFN